MDQTIVGNDIRHREHTIVSRLGEHVGAGTGQRALRGDQGFVHAVYPLDDPARAGQVEPWDWCTGQDARLRARRHHRVHRGRVHRHVGVEIEARKRGASRVAQPQSVRLARYRRLDDPYAVDLLRHRGGAVSAGVRHHDDIEGTRRGAVEQPAEVGRDDRFLVVRGYDDADYGLGHVGQDNPHRVRRSR
jgi:hypothetical protein